MKEWAALIEPLTLAVAGRTGWSESGILALPVRRLVRYLKHLKPDND